MAASTAQPISAWWLLRTGTRSWRVAAEEVVEVIPWPRLTPVPRSPGALLGITRRGDAIVPVVDPLAAGGMGAGTPAQWVVILRGRLRQEDMVFGLAADEIVPGDAVGAEPLDAARILAELASSYRRSEVATSENEGRS